MTSGAGDRAEESEAVMPSELSVRAVHEGGMIQR